MCGARRVVRGPLLITHGSFFRQDGLTPSKSENASMPDAEGNTEGDEPARTMPFMREQEEPTGRNWLQASYIYI